MTFVLTMPYVISTIKDGVDYCVRADSASKKFTLIPVKTDADLGKIFCHPYRLGATQVLNWINENDAYLASQQLKVCDEGQYR